MLGGLLKARGINVTPRLRTEACRIAVLPQDMAGTDSFPRSLFALVMGFQLTPFSGEHAQSGDVPPPFSTRVSYSVGSRPVNCLHAIIVCVDSDYWIRFAARGYLEFLGVPMEDRQLPTTADGLVLALALDACNDDNYSALLSALAHSNGPDSRQTTRRYARSIADHAMRTLDLRYDTPIARLYFSQGDHPQPNLVHDILQCLLVARPIATDSPDDAWSRTLCIMLSELRSEVTGRSLLREIFDGCYGDSIDTSINLAVTAGQDSDLLETLERLDDCGIARQAGILRDALVAFSELERDVAEEVNLGQPDEAVGDYIDPYDQPMTHWEALADQDLAKARTEVAFSSHRLRLVDLFDAYRIRWSRFFDLIVRHGGDAWNDQSGEIDRILMITHAACRALATFPDGHGRSLLARTAGLTLADSSRRTVSLLDGWHSSIKQR